MRGARMPRLDGMQVQRMRYALVRSGHAKGGQRTMRHMPRSHAQAQDSEAAAQGVQHDMRAPTRTHLLGDGGAKPVRDVARDVAFAQALEEIYDRILVAAAGCRILCTAAAGCRASDDLQNEHDDELRTRGWKVWSE